MKGVNLLQDLKCSSQPNKTLHGRSKGSGQSDFGRTISGFHEGEAFAPLETRLTLLLFTKNNFW